MSVRHLPPIVVNNANHPMLWIAFTQDLTSRTFAKAVRMVSEPSRERRGCVKQFTEAQFRAVVYSMCVRPFSGISHRSHTNGWSGLKWRNETNSLLQERRLFRCEGDNWRIPT